MFRSLFEDMPSAKYYETPPESIFNIIKSKSLELWGQYNVGTSVDYYLGKTKYVMDVENIRDNAWMLVSMFDVDNMDRLWYLIPEIDQIEIIEYCLS